jgi:hypothetical protein
MVDYKNDIDVCEMRLKNTEEILEHSLSAPPDIELYQETPFVIALGILAVIATSIAISK